MLDAVGSEAPVLGTAASTGAMNALFAATYPQRTSGIFWNYPRARLAWAPDYPWGQGPEAFENTIRRTAFWGTSEHALELAQSRAAQRLGIPDDQLHTLEVDEELVRRYARVTRNTVSPDAAEALMRIAWQTDVRDILPSVRAPAALLIGEGDGAAQVEEAEYVASLMPNATIHVLPGRSGLQTQATVEIIRSLAGIEQPHTGSTVLATVLFTDIVDLTAKQAQLGTAAGGGCSSPIMQPSAEPCLGGKERSTTPPVTASSRASLVPPGQFTARARSPNASESSESRPAPPCTSASARSQTASPWASPSRSERDPRDRDRTRGRRLPVR